MSQNEFPCHKCGALLKYSPGASALRCEYCGHENEIEADDIDIEELDYHAMLDSMSGSEDTQEVLTTKCTGCGASSTLDPNIAADACPFCGTDIVATGTSTKVLKPRSLLPFKITNREAKESFQTWLKKLWFAPNALKKKRGHDHSIQGIYIPHWTYDSEADTDYRGMRGTYYYVTQSYTTTVNGKSVRRTRQVRKTRWRSASGRVHDSFNDVLIRASHSLPTKHADELEPWDLKNLVPYKDDYLSGFKSETYQVSLNEGFDAAKGIMAKTIHHTICRDIGGDEQRVTKTHSTYTDITFKHILLPIWISSYRFKEKVYRFLVNARTGEVQGERPYSIWKIATLVITILAAIGIGVAIYYAYYEG